MTWYDYKIASWNRFCQIPDTHCLVCLVIMQCIYILYRWLNIDHLEDIQFLLCNYMASIPLTSLLINFLLWDFIMFEMFCLQEQLAFTMSLLKFSWSLSDFGKCCSIKFKNHLATLAEAFLSKGGFKQMM